ncbi:MAG: ABC transporter substrate-binding protein [Chloroflexi bacterium]|nr:ABC transporter substrate-binding protein [Chloroflexota bacterium]
MIRSGIVGDLPSVDGQQNQPTIGATVGWAYEALTHYDDKMQPTGLLAETWDLSTDDKSIKFNLRKGVTFHDGREFTSDDVKYSINRLKDPKVAAIAGQLGPQAMWWTQIDTPDKNTVVFTSDQPRPGVFDFFQYSTVVDHNLMDGPDAKTKVNGTGPFKFVEYLSGDHVTMTKNPSYWQTGKPYIDGFKASLLRDAQAMVAQLEAGALDLVDSPAILDLVRLKADPKYQAIVLLNSGSFVVMVANTTTAPTNNKMFRQGINYAINRQRFTDTALKGLISGGQDLPFPPQAAAYDAAKNSMYTFDLNKAKSLIQASGVTNTDMDFTYSNTTFGDLNQTLAQILQADLQSIGVKLTLKPVEFATQVDVATRRAYNGLLLSSGSGANLNEMTSVVTRSRFYSNDSKSSFTGLDDPKYTQLINQAASESDPAKRKALYSQIEDLILDDCATMAISIYPVTALAKSTVMGLTSDPGRTYTYTNAWLA